MPGFDCLLLASGGMDSTVLAYDLLNQKRNVVLLFLNYGQHCLDKELSTLKIVAPDEFKKNIKVIDISDIYEDSTSRLIRETDLWTEKITPEDLYLPYRNLLFLSIAVAVAQSLDIHEVYSAFINTNHAKEIDCSVEFFDKLDGLLEVYGSVKIILPYKNISKTEVAKLGVRLHAPIERTYSCQTNPQNPCGACPNCVDRLNAINNLLMDSTK